MLSRTGVLYKSPDRCSQVSYISVRKKERTKESERGYHAVHRNAINAKHAVIEHKVIMKMLRGCTVRGAWACLSTNATVKSRLWNKSANV